MKNLLALTLCLFIGMTAVLSQKSDIYMDKYLEIQKDFDARDIDAFTSHFEDQVNFVSPMGTSCSTKECIYESHGQLFKMWGPAPSDLTNNVKILQSFDLGSSHHLLSLKNHQTSGEESNSWIYTFIFEKIDSDLKVTSVQLTSVLEMK